MPPDSAVAVFGFCSAVDSAFSRVLYGFLIGNGLQMSILPDGEKQVSGNGRHHERGKDRRIPGERRREAEGLFTEEIGHAKDEEEAGEDADAEGGKERKRPADLSKGEQHEENAPSERARGEAGEESGEDVLPTGQGSEFRFDDRLFRRFGIEVRPADEVRGKDDEADASKPLDGDHVRTRVERLEDVFGKQHEDRDVGQMGDGEHERERETGEKPPSAVEHGSREKRFGMSRSCRVNESESGGQPEKPPKRRSGRIFDEVGHALEHLSEKIRPVHRRIEK